MTNTLPTAQLLRSDTKGRVQTPVKRREALLDEFERSAISASKFSALVGVKYQTFSAWVSKRRKERGQPAPLPEQKPEAARPLSPVRWMEAVVESAADTLGANPVSSLVIHLPGGARLEISNGSQASLAAQVLKLLAREGRC